MATPAITVNKRYYHLLLICTIKQVPVNTNRSCLLIIYLKTPGLISALGGSLGLFSGIAIIMIFEIFELAWDLFYNIWIFATLGKVPKITEDRREMQLKQGFK
jgi:hypothetical protein